MYNIKLMNKIAKAGTDKFDKALYEVNETEENPDAILVRSAALNDMEFPSNLDCIARAGAGVNNIPTVRAADEGIVVFNTPGANANSVKELVIAALFLASRDIIGGAQWAKGLKNDPDAAKKVEKGKSQFAGNEIQGKTLGIIGLGAIGRLVATAANALGMKIIGFDAFLNAETAKQLEAADVKIAKDYDEVYANSDFITIHIPSTPSTRGLFNANEFAKMKDGVKFLNFSRADLVNSDDMLAALNSGKVAKYVVDFPTPEMIDANENIIAIPHLGASTEESEDRCAERAANSIINYIEKGSIDFSVNYPRLELDAPKDKRICVLTKDYKNESDFDKISKVVGNYTFTKSAVNNAYYGYAVYDVEGEVTDEKLAEISSVCGVTRVRLI